MMRSRQTNRDSHHGSQGSDSSGDESDESPRGRSGKETAAEEAQVDAQIKELMGENSKSSGA